MMPPPITSKRAGDAGQLERAGGIDDARILGPERQPHASEPAAMMHCSKRMRFAAVATVRPRCTCGLDEAARCPRTTSTLRCLASSRRPPVSFLTTLLFQPRSLSQIERRLAETDAMRAIACGSSITLAACSSALDGMQPTFRHTPPRCAALDQRHLQAEIGGAKRGRIAAGPSQHQQLRAAIGACLDACSRSHVGHRHAHRVARRVRRGGSRRVLAAGVLLRPGAPMRRGRCGAWARALRSAPSAPRCAQSARPCRPCRRA